MIALLMQGTEAVAPTWGALGVGGVLAGTMFYFYRQDRKDSESRLQGIITDFRSIITDFRSIIESNTEAMTSLRDLVSDQHHDHQQDAARARVNGGRV